MFKIRKVSDRVIGIIDESVSPKEQYYAATFAAYSSEEYGDLIVLESRRPKSKKVVSLANIEINGAAPADMADAIGKLNEFCGSFKSGGGSPSPTPAPDASKPVLFFDYDGTLLYSYTLAEAQALTALPELPTHNLLAGTGWTHSLEDVKSATRRLHVGAQYRTTDGKTYAFVTLTPTSGLSLPICFTVTGTTTIRVDWGDGQTRDVTATSTITHNYASPGEYVITLERIAGTGEYSLGRGLPSTVFVGADVEGYRQVLTKVFIGDNAIIGERAFQACYSLKAIVIPTNREYVDRIKNSAFESCYSLKAIVIPNVSIIGNSLCQYCNSLATVIIPPMIISIGTYAFVSCHSLKSIVLPNSVITISNYAFQYSYATFESIVIPSSVTNIGVGAFGYCYSLNSIILESETPPTLANVSAFASGTPLRKYYVPDASVEAYKTATNWATYAAYIYPISEMP